MNIKLKNKTTFNRAVHDNDHPYLTISSETINNLNLTDAQLGLLVRMLNNSDDYILNTSYFQAKKSTLGKAAFGKALDRFKELGYLEKKQRQGGVDWTINEIPLGGENKLSVGTSSNIKESDIMETNIPDMGIPEIRNPDCKNPETETLINTKESIIKESSNKEKNTNEVIKDSDFINNNYNTVGGLSSTNNTEIDKVQSNFIKIFQFDDSIFDGLNTYNKVGEDIIDIDGVKRYIDKINQIWGNTTNNKYEELNKILVEIMKLILSKLEYEILDKIIKGNFKVIPQSFRTETNIRLIQLYLNLFDFLMDNEKELQNIVRSSTVRTKKNIENLDINKNKKKEYTNTTKILDARTGKEIVHYPTSESVSEDDYTKFNNLLIENKKLDKVERMEDMLKIRKRIQEYFEEKFDERIWNLIQEGKSYQIKFLINSIYNQNLINLYRNNVKYYLDSTCEDIAV